VVTSGTARKPGAIYRRLKAVQGGKISPATRWAARQGGSRRPALNGVTTSSGEVTTRCGGVKVAAALSSARSLREASAAGVMGRLGQRRRVVNATRRAGAAAVSGGPRLRSR
jgi:hypothetical protein